MRIFFLAFLRIFFPHYLRTLPPMLTPFYPLVWRRTFIFSDCSKWEIFFIKNGNIFIKNEAWEDFETSTLPRLLKSWATTYQGFVDWSTSTRACSWCLKVSLTVGFPLPVPRETVVVPTFPILATVVPNKSWKFKYFKMLQQTHPQRHNRKRRIYSEHSKVKMNSPGTWSVLERKCLRIDSWNRRIRPVERLYFYPQIRQPNR